MSAIKLDPSWLAPLEPEFRSAYMADLKQFLVEERAAGKKIFPPASLWLHALDTTPLDKVKAVILGQDPYHGPGQAHGLCFSVKPGVPTPPSLINIYRELEADLGITPAPHGNLKGWAQQGVLLLNSVLTVQAHQAASHRGKGWEQFTDAVIRQIDQRETPTVFILWGAYAQKKAAFVDTSKHLVLKAPHPSPLSAHNGFFGTKPFSKANAFLESRGIAPIDWRLA